MSDQNSQHVSDGAHTTNAPGVSQLDPMGLAGIQNLNHILRIIPTPASINHHAVDLASLEYVEPCNQNLTCAICRSPLVRPLKLPCEHVFCRACYLDTRFSQPQEDRCPTCRRRTRARFIEPVPRIVDQILEDLVVKCPFSNDGCTEEVARGMVQDHVDKYCEYVRISCPYENCHQEMQRKFLTIQRCLHHPVQCDKCGQAYPEISVSSHACLHDKEREMSCPDCAATFLGRDLKSHESSCPQANVPCIAASHGCDHISNRASIDQHHAICPLAKLAPFIALLSSRVEEQETALRHLHHKNGLLETSMHAMQGVFNSLAIPGLFDENGQFVESAQTFESIASAIVEIHNRRNISLVRALEPIIRSQRDFQTRIQGDLARVNANLTRTNYHLTLSIRNTLLAQRELQLFRRDFEQCLEVPSPVIPYGPARSGVATWANEIIGRARARARRFTGGNAAPVPPRE